MHRTANLIRAAALIVALVGASAPAAFAQAPAAQAAAPPPVAPAPADARPLVQGRFTVEVVGRGPDVILIPGLSSSRDTYAEFVRQDAGRHRLHLIQLAGFAGTPAGANAQGDEMIAPSADAIARYIEASHLRRPAVVGHSLGGLIALMLAERHGDLISRAEIVDSYPFFALLFSDTVTSAQAGQFAAPMRDRMTGASDADWAQSAAMQAPGFTTSPEHQRQVQSWMMASDRGVVARAFYEDTVTDLRPDLGKVRVPVQVLYAFSPVMGATPDAYDAKVAKMYAALPGVKLVRVDDSRHFIMFDQPQRFDALTEAFLDAR